MVQKKFEIRWTANAFEGYEKIYNELLFNWSVEVAEKFRHKVESRLYNLSFQPYIGRLSEKRENIRSILLSKYNRLYYRLTEDTIELISLFDMRQDPFKNKFD
jgi:plasmid stabilization system protein ParE